MNLVRLFKTLFIASVLLTVLLGTSTPVGAALQSKGREVRLTLLPDFERRIVEVEGSVSPGDIPAQAATLADWGIGDSLTAWKTSGIEHTWNIFGPLSNSEIRFEEEEARYYLSLGPLSLAPNDSLTLVIPFTNIHWQDIEPPPENLAQITDLSQSFLPTLNYSTGDTKREFQLDIPFTVIKKEINLSLTPLVGEALVGHTDSFRLSGQVTFEGVEDFAEFKRHCENSPDDFFFRYRVANLLFALDSPPAYHFGFLNSAYQFKPTYSLLRSDLSSCHYETDQGSIKAQFTGRGFNVAQNAQRFPQELSSRDVAENHQKYAGPRNTGGEYELQMGEIVLGPEDVLKISVPDTTLHSLNPPPTRFVFERSEPSQIEYQGPQRFTLSIRYTPNPQLLLQQIPATVRAFLTPVETQFSLLFDQEGKPARRLWTWGLLIIGLALAVTVPNVDRHLQIWWGVMTWLLLSVALLYGVRGIFGWLLLAVVWHFIRTSPRKPSVTTRGLALILVLLALLADAQAEALFTVLSSVELELTPLTPLILTILGLTLYGLVRRANISLGRASLSDTLPMIFFLFTLVVYDVIQESLPALFLMACGGIYIAYRIHQLTGSQQPQADLLYRFKLVWQSWLVPVGILVMTALAIQHDLQQTAAVFGPALGLWGSILIPILLFMSVLLALSAIALLFILLYPVLPFQTGYLKAIVLGVFLLSLFIFGVGSDDRLITVLGNLLVGRLIYYLSVPLLIGLYFDIDHFRQEKNKQREAVQEPGEPLSMEKAIGLYLKQLRGFASAIGSILSLVAPSLFAFFFDQPLVTTYFDLLEQLIALSVVGL